jgi:DNA-binding transcriptional regulator/RsmH inhibitor MraZ
MDSSKFTAHFFRTAKYKKTDSTWRIFVIQNMAAAVEFNKLVVMAQGLSCRSEYNSTILLLHVIPIARQRKEGP